MKAFYRFLTKYKVLKDGGELTSLDAPENIRLVLSKFGTSIHEIWSCQALKIENETQGEPIPFAGAFSEVCPK